MADKLFAPGVQEDPVDLEDQFRLGRIPPNIVRNRKNKNTYPV